MQIITILLWDVIIGSEPIEILDLDEGFTIKRIRDVGEMVFADETSVLIEMVNVG